MALVSKFAAVAAYCDVRTDIPKYLMCVPHLTPNLYERLVTWHAHLDCKVMSPVKLPGAGPFRRAVGSGCPASRIATTGS